MENLVIGIYTHRVNYLVILLESIKNYYPDLPVIVQIAQKDIHGNFNTLLKQLEKTKYKYWLILDDDVEFLDNQAIPTALEYLKKNELSLTTIHQVHKYLYPNKRVLKRLPKHNNISFAWGYFMLVDSAIFPYKKIPQFEPIIYEGKNIAHLDIDFCYYIQELGGKIGLAPAYLKHECHFSKDLKEPSLVPPKNELQKIAYKNAEKFTQKLEQKLDKNSLKIIGKIPKNKDLKLFVLDTGEIDKYKTIAHIYLRNKYSENYLKYTSKLNYNTIITNANNTRKNG
jgi:hypothetical protein